MSKLCPLCQNDSIEDATIYPLQDKNFFYNEILNCRECQLGIALPYKNQQELSEYYDSGAYWSDASNKNVVMHNHNQAKKRVSFLLEKITLPTSHLTVFDIGAGHGFIGDVFLSMHPEKISNYFFMEPDDTLSKNIAQRIPKATRVKSPRTSDVVFLNHILEHTASPLDSLKYFTQELTPGSYVYIEVPNRDDKFKQDVTPHSIFFTKEGLQKVITQAGLECIVIECFGDKDSTIPNTITFLKKFKLRIYYRATSLLTNLGLLKFAEFLDDLIFDYQTKRGDGMWLRAISRK